MAVLPSFPSWKMRERRLSPVALRFRSLMLGLLRFRESFDTVVLIQTYAYVLLTYLY